MKKLRNFLVELACAYFIAGVFANVALKALHASGIHCDALARLCSKLFEGPFVTLFGIW